MKSLNGMNPRELMALWERVASLANEVNRTALTDARAKGWTGRKAKGPRALKRRQRRQRARAHARRLQRTTWKSHFEDIKRHGEKA